MRIVVALNAEAKPLIEAFKLKARTPRGAFPIYERDEFALIISGIGKVAAAAATTYLYTLTGQVRDIAWLNVGVAGHGARPLGEGVIAHRLTDAATGRRWYPPQIFRFPCPTDELLSVDTPQTKYPTEAMYDMEAAGFYATATRFSTAELVQCYKVISDNRSIPVHEVNASCVQQQIGARLDEIRKIVALIVELSQQWRTIGKLPVELDAFTERWRFTVSQRHQLERLLQRWAALAPDQPLWREEFAKLRTTQDVLKTLERHIRALPVRFYV